MPLTLLDRRADPRDVERMDVVNVGGIAIGYRRVGSGPAIVFAHGGGSDGREWRHQLEGLADEFTVVAWDEPGAGRSGELPDSAGVEDYADALGGLVEALELDPAFICGLSWGGVVALQTYYRRPGFCAGLILADTYAGWKGSLPQEEIEARLAGLRENLKVPAEEFAPMIPGLWGPNPDPAVVAELTRIEADARPERFTRVIEIIAECDLSGLLPHITVPTLLIWGAHDARSPVATVARQFEAAISGAELVVLEGAGHMSSMERPVEFNAAVRRFCRTHSQRDGA